MSLPNAAVVGLGFMGATHIQALRRLGVPVVGALGTDRTKTGACDEGLRIPRFYHDYAELLADSRVQVVHICTPNALHYDMVRQALLAGKHVICEKPLAISSQQSIELVVLARERGLTGVVCYNLRFYPLCQEARQRILAGDLGEVRLINGAYLQDWLVDPAAWNWHLDPALSGPLRTVIDVGVHWLDMIPWLTGLRIQSVMADLATFISTRQKPRKPVNAFTGGKASPGETDPVTITSDDAALILLRFENGARGMVSLSQMQPGRKNAFWWEIGGSQASLRWDQESPNALWIGHNDRPNEILIKDPNQLHPSARTFAGYPSGHAEGYPDTFYQLFRQVYTALECGTPLDPAIIPTFESGHRGLLLCEAILKSAQEEKWVDISY